MHLDLQKFYSSLAVPAGSELVIAVSGGLDSTMLLSLTAALFREGALPGFKKLSVLHVNHRLRGEESDGDEAFVVALAKKMGLSCRVERLLWQEEESRSQASCRNKREAIYKTLGPNTFFALAHHRDDLAETVFLRLLRGTGLRGLQAMAAVSGKRLRPLLAFSRAEILQEAKKQKMKWREDSSNKKTKYERNWIRQEIFPALEARRPGFSRRLADLSNETRALLQEQSPALPRSLAIASGSVLYKKEELKKLKPAELSQFFGINRLHTEKLQLFFQKDSGKYTLPGKALWSSCGLVLMGDSLEAIRDWQTKNSSHNFSSVLGEWIYLGKNKNHSLRPYQTGESRALKDVLIKHRVPAFFRESLPLLADGKEHRLLLPKSFEKKCTLETPLGAVVYMPSEFCERLVTELRFVFA